MNAATGRQGTHLVVVQVVAVLRVVALVRRAVHGPVPDDDEPGPVATAARLVRRLRH